MCFIGSMRLFHFQFVSGEKLSSIFVNIPLWYFLHFLTRNPFYSSMVYTLERSTLIPKGTHLTLSQHISWFLKTPLHFAFLIPSAVFNSSLISSKRMNKRNISVPIKPCSLMNILNKYFLWICHSSLCF